MGQGKAAVFAVLSRRCEVGLGFYDSEFVGIWSACGKGARNPANSRVGFHSFLRCVTVAFERQGGAETDR